MLTGIEALAVAFTGFAIGGAIRAGAETVRARRRLKTLDRPKND